MHGIQIPSNYRKKLRKKGFNALHQILIVIWNKEQICFLNLLVSAMADSPDVTEGWPSKSLKKKNQAFMRPAEKHRNVFRLLSLCRKIFTTLSFYLMFLNLDDLQNQLRTKYHKISQISYPSNCAAGTISHYFTSHVSRCLSFSRCFPLFSLKIPTSYITTPPQNTPNRGSTPPALGHVESAATSWKHGSVWGMWFLAFGDVGHFK